MQRLPQPQLEALLQDHIRGLGVEVRRGHEVTGLQQDGDAVHLEVQGPDGPYRISAQYVVGCDGVRSRVRDLAGMLDGVNLAWKLAATIQGWAPPGLLDTYHSERHLAGERLLLHAQAQVSLRRGHDPADEALRKVFSELVSDAPTLARVGAMIAASDVRYPMTGAQPHALAGTFASGLRDDVVAALRAARPVFVGPAKLCDVAAPWADRVDILDHPGLNHPDALLIRPDAHIAWAGATETGLRDALTHWFGEQR